MLLVPVILCRTVLFCVSFSSPNGHYSKKGPLGPGQLFELGELNSFTSNLNPFTSFPACDDCQSNRFLMFSVGYLHVFSELSIYFCRPHIFLTLEKTVYM